MVKEVNGWKVVEIGESQPPEATLPSGRKLHKAVEIKEEDELGELSASDMIPAGYRELKNVTGVFLSDNEIVVTGEPDEDDETHNCDELGCSSISHVIFRTSISGIDD